MGGMMHYCGTTKSIPTFGRFEGSMNQTFRAASIGIRNILLGANLRSLAKLLRPRQLAFYSTQTLFFYDSLFRNGLPVKNVREVLPHEEFADVSLFLGTDDFWINDLPSGGVFLFFVCSVSPPGPPTPMPSIGTETAISPPPLFPTPPA